MGASFASEREVSTSLRNDRVVSIVMLAASLALAVWYAQAQLIYSLHFLYQLSRALFPVLVPDVGAPG